MVNKDKQNNTTATATKQKADNIAEITEKSVVAAAPRKAILDDDDYSVRPFEYKEGLSIIDIIDQSKAHKERLQTKLQNTRRTEKIAGWMNLLSAMGTMAGGGYTSARHKPLAIYDQAKQKAGAYEDELHKTDLYYKELARKARLDEYNQQLERHKDSEKMRLDMQMRNNQFNRKLQNDVEEANYKAGLTERTSRVAPQYEIDNRNAQTSAARTNAETARMNANTSAERLALDKIKVEKENGGEKLFLTHTYDNGAGKPLSLNKSGALAVIASVREEYARIKNKPDSELTPMQKSIKNDYANMVVELNSANAESSDNIIRDMALRYIRQDPERYRYLDINKQTGNGQSIADLLSDESNQVTETDTKEYVTNGPSMFR